jgi:hypothetical protein
MTTRLRHAAATPVAAGDRASQKGPVIVLAYPFSGSQRIWRLLSDSTVLACTSGTGLLPLCEQAVATWRQVDNRDGPPSALAVRSTRALADCMITTMLASTGRSRWCEISYAAPVAAEAFLRLYPGTKFICLHRSCPDVIRAAIEAHPWGLGDSGIGRFAALYPGSSAAAIAAYWAGRTEPLLEFEAAHPAACLRVSYEDLARQPSREEEILAFLNLERDGPAACALTAGEPMAPAEEATPLTGRVPVPADYLPPPLRQKVSQLQAILGYPPITSPDRENPEPNSGMVLRPRVVRAAGLVSGLGSGGVS